MLDSASTAGTTSVSMNRAKRSDIVSYSNPRSLPLLSPPPLATAMATKGGNRRAGSELAVRLSKASFTFGSCSGPSFMMRYGASVPSWYLAGMYTSILRVNARGLFSVVSSPVYNALALELMVKLKLLPAGLPLDVRSFCFV
jgi:hypothetical protein